MLTTTWKCNCYYTKNIYSSELNVHVTFENRDQFLLKYRRNLQAKHINSPTEIDGIIQSLTDEVNRRRHDHISYNSIKEQIIQNYVPIYQPSQLYTTTAFDKPFIDICLFARHCALADDILRTETSILHTVSHSKQIYSFPFFTKDFCKRFVEEIKRFQSLSDIPKLQPNTMNKYGLFVDFLGCREFISNLVSRYLKSLTRLLYSEVGGDTVDSFKAFVVTYNDDIRDLSTHYDNAEISINVSLNEDFIDGNLYFGGMRQDKDEHFIEVEHNLGMAIIHRGQQIHGAFPITSGERHNLIIWMRSSPVRNKCCPMCDNAPDLVDLSENGDGFTKTDYNVNVCTTF